MGKERLAHWLHAASPRRGRPFVAVNGGAFTDPLLERELFGHARGVFEAAYQGTLCLDEVGACPSRQRSGISSARRGPVSGATAELANDPGS